MDVGGVCSDEIQVNYLSVCFGVEDKENITMRTFLFKHIWRKQPIIIEMTRGPFGIPALMRNDPLR
jgi:hypothetical protein